VCFAAGKIQVETLHLVTNPTLGLGLNTVKYRANDRVIMRPCLMTSRYSFLYPSLPLINVMLEKLPGLFAGIGQKVSSAKLMGALHIRILEGKTNVKCTWLFILVIRIKFFLLLKETSMALT
jgi:hypothetical protein